MTDEQANKPRGILRNRDEQSNVSLGTTTPASPDEPSKFDRQAVLENTKANAQIHTVGEAIIKKSQTELADELSKKNKKANLEAYVDQNGDRLPEHLKWDEANLYLTEQEKNATMKITEPKTPYQGTVGESEYYKDDDGDDIPPLDDTEGGLLLGEPELHPSHDPTLEDGRILKDEVLLKQEAEEAAREQEEEDEGETVDEKHKRFEQLRKQHYHMKGNILHQKVDLDEEEEEDEEDDALKQAKANAATNLQ